MAEVEWDHEAYFRDRVLRHPLSRLIRVWPALPPRESIRSAFATSAHETQAREHRMAEPQPRETTGPQRHKETEARET